MNDYEKYEDDCRKIRKTNEELLSEFKAWLEKSGLSKNTVAKHYFNMDFYLNGYLLYYDDPTEAKDGIYGVSTFLGYWFIRKAMWATPASIKSNATSLKKFYTFLLEKGLIDKEDLSELKHIIKQEMPDWQATLKRYDDPTIEIEDVW